MGVSEEKARMLWAREHNNEEMNGYLGFCNYICSLVLERESTLAYPRERIYELNIE